VADVTTWSRLTGLREVVERLRPQLVVHRDERGRELFDVPGAPLPDADLPAPVRFLPEYDNVLLSHADRSRFLGDEERAHLAGATKVLGTVLVDGRVAAAWHPVEGGLVVEHVPRLGTAARRAVAAEGRRLQRLRAPEVEPRVELRPLP
jgi:hypothetical protein